MNGINIPIFDDIDFGAGQFPGDALYDVLATMRQQSEIVKARFMGMECYVLVSYAAILEAYRDNDRFPPEKIYQMMFEPISGRTFQTMTGQEHIRWRQLATPAFRARNVRAYDEEIMTDLAHELLDRLAGQKRVDLAATFTRLFPFILISRLLGIPRDAEDRFHDWAVALLRFAEDPKRAKAANTELTAYLEPVIQQRRQQPETDIVSDLVTAEIDGQGFSDEEVLSHIRLIFSAGASTTHDAMGNLLYHLLTRHELWQQVVDDTDTHERAVEELLRFDPSVAVLPRTAAAAPVEFRGQQLSQNALVLFANASGNRDPKVFEAPDEFRLDREAHPILTTFGPGPRACPGMHLARRQLALVLSVIMERHPEMRIVDDDGNLPVGAVLRGPAQLLVELNS